MSRPRCETNGFVFEQNEDGSVQLTLKAKLPGDVDVTTRIDPGIWGSIIANMSYYGENDSGWYRAMNFHGGIPLGPTTPIQEKPRLW